MGSDKASTRIAGVYALMDIADTYRGRYRQRVVDILCGYLRSDRETYPLDEDGKPATGLPRSGDADKAVESTILSVMHDRLRKERKDETGKTIVRQTVDDDQLWCDCAFDLHEATFHEIVDLTDSTFERYAYFYGTKFERYADFSRARFTVRACFIGACFAGSAYFDGATFARGADFRVAEFRGGAAFSGIQGQPSFGFEECKFNKIFRGAYEWGPIPIPKDNDELPAGAVWADFPEEDDKDGGTTSR